MHRDCERVRRAIDERWMGGVDSEPVDAHLAECVECADFARRTESAIQAARTVSVEPPRDLAFRTQFRVSLRAQELRGRSWGWTLWVSLGLSWAVGIASAPLVWRALEWMGRNTGLPETGVRLAFGLWWAAPVAIAAGLWAFDKKKMEEEER
jgi:predicted anti-sigma-YlaC factor YlaD